MKRATEWACSFWGKHPAFADFIRINADDELLSVFIQWLAKQGGFPPVSDPGGDGKASIHFWVVLPNTSRLTCGLITASSDSAGRPSPAFLAMKGRLPEKPDHCWERISLYCRAPWHDMARLLTCGFASVSAFRKALLRTSPPGFAAGCDDCGQRRMEEIRDMIREALARDKEYFVRDKMLCFTVKGHFGGMSDWLSWNRAIREVVDVMPFSWFVRNSGYDQKLYLFYRPLGVADFQMIQQRK